MILALRLQNFKCFENQSLIFRPLTLLSGLNGLGKSTVLQALLLLRQSHQQGMLSKTGLALNGELVRIGSASDALFEGAQEEKIGIEVLWEGTREGKWIFNYTRDADVLEVSSLPVQPEVFTTSLFSDRFQYLQAERIGPRTFFEMSYFAVRQHKQLGTRGEYAAHFLSAFGRDTIPHQNLAHPDAQSNQLRDQVEAWMGEVSPGIRIHFTPHSGMDLMSVQYSYVTGRQVSNPYRSTNVGFGITYTLPILVAILASPSGSLILLENPEAHLHPKGQVKIGDLIARAASCGIQILVETHSDHVLNGIRLAVHDGRLKPEQVQLHFFERREQQGSMRNEVISPSMDRDGRIDRWPEGFFDEWDKSLEALLEPRNE